MNALKEHLDKLAPNLAKTTPVQDFELPDLTPEEEQEAIQKAREDKYYRERKAEYFERISKPAEVKLFNAEQLHAKLSSAVTPTGKNVSIDKYNKDIVRWLCLYFSNDPEFETIKDNFGSNFSLTKGLCLMGNVGVGKTFLMGFFNQNQNQSYVMVNCRKIESTWVEQMSAKEKPVRNIIDIHTTSIQTAVNGNAFGHLALGACFDDLGTETCPSKAYGEEKNVLAEILMNRYESGLPFNYTHITTNLSAHDIRLRYGTRISDRFREMFNLVTFNNEAKSRRV